MQPSEAVREEFEALGIEPPTIEPHGTEEEVRDLLKPLHMSNWRQIGNTLICDTEHGEFAQTIPTDHLLTGIDEKGMPTFTKVTL